MPPRKSKAAGARKPSRAKVSQASQSQPQCTPAASQDMSMPTPRRRRVGKGPEIGAPCVASEAQPFAAQPFASPLRVMASPLRAAALQPAHEDDDRTPRASECGDVWVTAPTSPGGTTQCYDDTASERTATYDDGSAGEASQTFASPSPERVPAPRGRQACASPSPQTGRSLRTTPQRGRKSRGRWRVVNQAPEGVQSPAVPTPMQAQSCRTPGRRRRFSNSAVPPLPPPPNTGTVYNMTGQTPKARTRRLSGLTVRTLLKRRSLAATTPPAQEAGVGDYDAACRALWTGTQPPAAGAAAPHSVPSLKELLAAKAEEPPAVEAEHDLDEDAQAAQPVGAGDDSFEAASPCAGQPSTEAGISWAKPRATRAAGRGAAAASAVAPTEELHRQSRVAAHGRTDPSAKGRAAPDPGVRNAEATNAHRRHSHHSAASRNESPPTPAWLRMCEKPRGLESEAFAPVATRAAASKGGGGAAGLALETAPSALAFSREPRRRTTSKSRTMQQQAESLEEPEGAEGCSRRARELRSGGKPLAWAEANIEVAPSVQPGTAGAAGVQKGATAQSMAPAAAVKQREAVPASVEAANLPTPCRRSSRMGQSMEVRSSETRGRRAEPKPAADDWLRRLPPQASVSDSEEEEEDANLTGDGGAATTSSAAHRPFTQNGDPFKAAVAGAASASAQAGGGQRGARAQMAAPTAYQAEGASAAGRRRISQKRPEAAVAVAQAQVHAQGSTPTKAVPRRISSKSAQGASATQSPAARGGQAAAATVAPSRAAQCVAVLTSNCGADSESDEASLEPEAPSRSAATVVRARSAARSAVPTQLSAATAQRDSAVAAERPRGAAAVLQGRHGHREGSASGSLGRTEMLAFEAAFQEGEVEGSAAVAAARGQRREGGQVSEVAGQGQGRTAGPKAQAACSVLQPPSEDEEEDEEEALAPRRQRTSVSQAVAGTRGQGLGAQPHTSQLGAQPRSRTPSTAPAGAAKAWSEQQQSWEAEPASEPLQAKAVTASRGHQRTKHTSLLGAQPQSGMPAAAQAGSVKVVAGQQSVSGWEPDETFETAEARNAARHCLGVSHARGQRAPGSVATRHTTAAPAAVVLNQQSASEEEDEEVEEEKAAQALSAPRVALAARAHRACVQQPDQQRPPPVQSARAISSGGSAPLAAARAAAQKRAGYLGPGQGTAAATLASGSESEEEQPAGALALPTERGAQMCQAKRQRVGGRIVGGAQNAGVLMREEEELEPTEGRSSYGGGRRAQSPLQPVPQAQEHNLSQLPRQQPKRVRGQRKEGLAAEKAAASQEAGPCPPKRQRAGAAEEALPEAGEHAPKPHAEEEPSAKRQRLAGKAGRLDVASMVEETAPPAAVLKGQGRGGGRGRGNKGAKAKPGTGSAMHFVTTGLSLSDTQQQMAEALNAKVADVWSPQATHLIADTFRRTSKLMCAICSGAAIVTPDFISACGAAGKRVDEGPYFLRDAVCEAGFARRRDLKAGFSVGDAVERARRHGPLLKGMSVYCFPSVKDKRDLPQLVAVAGGAWLKDIPSKVDSSVLLLAERTASSEEEKQQRKTREVYDVEFLYEAACTQEFRRSYYRLH